MASANKLKNNAREKKERQTHTKSTKSQSKEKEGKCEEGEHSREKYREVVERGRGRSIRFGGILIAFHLKTDASHLAFVCFANCAQVKKRLRFNCRIK